MTLKFSDKFDHPFSHVYIFDNMLPESPGFVAMYQSNDVSKIYVPNYPYL